MKFLFFLAAVISFSNLSEAKAPPASGLKLIQESIGQYNKVAGVSMAVKKTVKLALLDETKTSEGNLYFSKGQLRLELAKPEDSLVVLTAKEIWVESSIEGLNGPEKHVMKIVSKDLKKRTKAPLALLLTDQKAWGQFKVLSSKKVEQKMILNLKPKDPQKFPELTQVSIELKPEEKEILKLSYQDEIENEVSFEFTDLDFSADVSTHKFKYTPPKNAEVVIY